MTSFSLLLLNLCVSLPPPLADAYGNTVNARTAKTVASDMSYRWSVCHYIYVRPMRCFGLLLMYKMDLAIISLGFSDLMSNFDLLTQVKSAYFRVLESDSVLSIESNC